MQNHGFSKHVHEYEHENDCMHDKQCQCLDCESNAVIRIIAHDDAISASFCQESILPLDVLCSGMSKCMYDLAEWVKENLGIVGHIKASIVGGSGAIMLSITKNVVNEKNNSIDLQPPYAISLNAIVFNMEKQILKNRLLSIYKKFSEC